MEILGAVVAGFVIGLLVFGILLACAVAPWVAFGWGIITFVVTTIVIVIIVALSSLK